jgi:predicted solute-binding protein
MLVHPQGWKELGGDMVLIRLRCPNCFASTTASVRHEVLAQYDKELVSGRNAMLAQYEALVYHNMSELAKRFAHALELDLIGADDFGRRLCARQAA